MLSSILIMALEAFFGLFGMVFLLRFWMNLLRVRAPASVGLFVAQLTDWIVRPLRHVIPSTRNIDWATLLCAVLAAVLLALTQNLLTAFSISPQIVGINSALTLIQWIYYGLFAALIAEVVLSWVGPYTPTAHFVRQLNLPLLQPIRRVVPPIGGVDLSPLIAFVLLRIALYAAMYGVGVVAAL